MYNFAEDAADNPTFYADITNPQSLNKYQYTYNNPVNLVDPDGHWPDLSGFVVPSPKVTIAIISNPLDSLQAVISVVGLVPGAGEVADVANAAISAARGNYADAALDLAGAAGPVGSAVAVGNRVRKIAKAVNKVDELATGASATKKGVTAEKAANVAKAEAQGIPKSELGPSGKPKVVTVKHATDKRAQDAAQARSKGRPVKHVNPRKGSTHYHSTDKSGKPRKGKQNIHHQTSR